MAVNFARLPELLALEKSERIFDGRSMILKPAAREPDLTIPKVLLKSVRQLAHSHGLDPRSITLLNQYLGRYGVLTKCISKRSAAKCLIRHGSA